MFFSMQFFAAISSPIFQNGRYINKNLRFFLNHTTNDLISQNKLSSIFTTIYETAMIRCDFFSIKLFNIYC